MRKQALGLCKYDGFLQAGFFEAKVSVLIQLVKNRQHLGEVMKSSADRGSPFIADLRVVHRNE